MLGANLGPKPAFYYYCVASTAVSQTHFTSHTVMSVFEIQVQMFRQYISGFLVSQIKCFMNKVDAFSLF